MANSIALAQKYLPVLDAVYKRASLSTVLDGTMVDVNFSQANAVKIFKTALQGLANYNRNNGFVKGDVTGTWEILTLTKDRGRSFMVDRMDNEEQAFGTLVGEFLRVYVVPEIDAYRFATYAGASGILTATPATPTAANIVSAIDTANSTMSEAEVPVEGRILFITPTMYGLLKSSTNITRFATMRDDRLNRDFVSFDNMRVIQVPQTRFYTAITLNDGATSGQEIGGYIKSTAAKDINFMIIHPSAVLQVEKHVLPRIFDPDTNQTADAWKFDYRIYHDAFTYENKVKGIYLHNKA